MWMAILKPEITGKYSKKQQPTENQRHRLLKLKYKQSGAGFSIKLARERFALLLSVSYACHCCCPPWENPFGYLAKSTIERPGKKSFRCP